MKIKILFLAIANLAVLIATSYFSFTLGKLHNSSESWTIKDTASSLSSRSSLQGPLFAKQNGSLLFNCTLDDLLAMSDRHQTIIGFYSRENTVTKVGQKSGIKVVSQPYESPDGVLSNFDGIEPILKEAKAPYYVASYILLDKTGLVYNVVYFPNQFATSDCESGFAIAYPN
jgi:hypothetical protein